MFLSLLITENSKYFDMVVELQQKRLVTFSNLTKSRELNNNVLDNSNIIVEAIHNINSHKSLLLLVSIFKICYWLLSVLKVFAKIILKNG